MARINIITAGETLGVGVSDFDSVYLSGTVWELAINSIIPDGIYEGNDIVVTPGSATLDGRVSLDTVFEPDSMDTITDTIDILTTATLVPDSVTVIGTGTYVHDGSPVLEWTPAILDFGGTIITQEKDLELIIENTTPVPLDLVMTTPEGIYMRTPGDPTVLIQSLIIAITSSGNYTVDLVFIPTEVREYPFNVYSTVTDGSTIDYIELFPVTGRGTYAENFLNLLSTNVDAEYTETVIETDEEYQYIDFDVSLIKNPLTDDIYKKYDQYAVEEAIKHLLLSPKLWTNGGLDVRGLIFENVGSPFHLSRIASTLEDYIVENEPRVSQVSVGSQIDFNDDTKLDLQISYALNSNTNVFYQFPVFIRTR